MIVVSFIRNKLIMFLVSLFSSLLILLQLISIYISDSFIDYKFYLHFNTRDILGIIPFFDIQLLFALSIFLIFSYLIFSSKKIYLAVTKLTLFRYLFFRRISKTRSICLKFLIIFFSIFIFTLKDGILYEASDLISIISVSDTDFDNSLDALNMTDYIIPSDLKAQKGKNIIIISLESIERGYLNGKMEYLTPQLQGLKNRWQYFDIEPARGSEWTSGSLYTFMTGIPAYFNIHGNSIFQTSFSSKITSIPHVLKKAGYTMSFIINDAEFSGTRDMLLALGVKDIFDQETCEEDVLLHDKDLFKQAKLFLNDQKYKNQSFALFLSTIDTHFPNGYYDNRMNKYLPSHNHNTDLEFSVSAVDYLVGELINFLTKEDMLTSTTIYIFPDHLKMGESSMFEGTGSRGLYLITNSDNNNLYGDKKPIYQIDLPNIILKGADIKHNAKFLSDYIPEDDDKLLFIKNNKELITSLNVSGFNRVNNQPYTALVDSTQNFMAYAIDTNRYIAHAGGMIDSIPYTNSLEALEVNYANGFRLFELDIIKTLDNIYVAAHDWDYWVKLTNYKGQTPVSNKEFLSYKLLGKYTPIDIARINEWFKEHEDAILVTDKINDPEGFANVFLDRNRLIMELFTLEALEMGLQTGIRSAMPSQCIIDSLGDKKLKTLQRLNVKHIAISRNYLSSHIKFLEELKKNDIKVYVYHVNFEEGKNEEYVVKYEMDYIYGIYADQWDFSKYLNNQVE
jgi:glycerophosphoryl diester phosphodiesterase